ncbi:MAG TPA: hypothetical protein VFB76_15645 [Candidatus Angelobacter sp.]|nr:hypothetical protein [Candidatus Angelobacter sp.]
MALDNMCDNAWQVKGNILPLTASKLKGEVIQLKEDAMANSAIPVIDPSVRHVGVSKLRELNATKLKETKDETLVIQDNDTPVAVLLSYEKFMIMQGQLMAIFNTLELVTDDVERNGLVAGLADLRAGRIQPFADIEAELEKK